MLHPSDKCSPKAVRPSVLGDGYYPGTPYLPMATVPRRGISMEFLDTTSSQSRRQSIFYRAAVLTTYASRVTPCPSLALGRPRPRALPCRRTAVFILLLCLTAHGHLSCVQRRIVSRGHALRPVVNVGIMIVPLHWSTGSAPRCSALSWTVYSRSTMTRAPSGVMLADEADEEK